MSDHDHCDHDPIECSYNALVGEYREAVAERNELRARLDSYEGAVEERERINQLIADSSLGTPEARAIQARTPRPLGRAIVRAVEEMERAERLRTIVVNTATDARILVKALEQGNTNAAAAIAERIYERHEPYDVGEGG